MMHTNDLLKAEIRKAGSVLDTAWDAACSNQGMARLDAFQEKIRPFLDLTQYTQPQRSPKFCLLRFEPQDWRTLCLHRLLVTLAIIHEDHGTSLIGDRFWNHRLPAFLLSPEVSASAPPIAPSSTSPTRGDPTAYRDNYLDWANSNLLQRLNGMADWMQRLAPADSVYSKTPESLKKLGHQLSAATALHVGQRLYLTFEGTSVQDLVSRLANSNKLCRQSPKELLWPPAKIFGRCWADLLLSPLLRQVIRFEPGAWAEQGSISLCVTNRVNTQWRNDKGKLEQEMDRLHYWQIRLAVTCEIVLRQFNATSLDQEGARTIMTTIPAPERIPSVISPLAHEMQEISAQRPPHSPDSADRFNGTLPQSVRQLLLQDGARFKDAHCHEIPVSLLSPVFEENVLSLNLEVGWLSENLSLLDVYLLASNGSETPLSLLEIANDDAPQPEHSGSPIRLELCGNAWQELTRRYPMPALEAAWEGSSLFAVKRDVIGTGFILVGLVDLSRCPRTTNNA